MALTDKELRKSRPEDKAYRLPDSKGLFLFITPTGGNRGAATARNGPS
jgi:hypothetical protein